MEDPKEASEDGSLKTWHLGRPPNDNWHHIGINAFSLIVPLAFIVLWSLVFASAVHHCWYPVTTAVG